MEQARQKGNLCGDSPPFGDIYAGIYDAINHDKDYSSECDLLERIFSQYAQIPVRRILDLGCGTGHHAERLAERGYEVVGVDRSPHMVGLARSRHPKNHSTQHPDYYLDDLRSFRIDRKFDAAIMMFAVLSYQLEDHDVLAALETTRVHLREGGLLLFDFWYGPAVHHQRPTNRTKTTNTGKHRIIRQASAVMDEKHHRVAVNFHVDRIAKGASTQTDETHSLRYFFEPEIHDFLKKAGFLPQRIGAMPDFDRVADETSWNVLAVARCGGSEVDRA